MSAAGAGGDAGTASVGNRLFPVADILGVPVARCTTGEFIDALVARLIAPAQGQRPLFITYLNAWCSDVSAQDPEYARILASADAVYADGMAVVWAARLLGRPLPERVNAGDFIAEFCVRCAAAGLRIYLLGSAEGVAERAARRLESLAPGLRIAGARSGYFTDGGAGVLAEIDRLRPDLVLVGMGVPLQEKWCAANMDRIGARAVWCVGALFEYYGEARARAPVWMRRAGLEWFFRLALEPGRMWRRYLVGNAVFVWRVLCAAARQR